MFDPFIGQILAGKYRIEEILREGGMGKIYRGTHTLMDKKVAVKILSPALAVDAKIVERFAREAKTLSKISHPHVLNVTDYGVDDETVFIVMEAIEGESLKDEIARNGKFSLSRAADITEQVARGLAAAHAQGVIHRNLKSENIMLGKTSDGADYAKILDFGLVQIGENEGLMPDDDHEAVPQMLTGNPEYMSPEQCSDAADIDERTDVYSLGIVLYEMLTGATPFSSGSATDIMIKHVQEPPPPMLPSRPDLSTDVEQIAQRALAKQPVQRYQSVTDLSDALKRLATKPALADDADTVIRIRPQDGANSIDGLPAAPPPGNPWKTAFVVLCGIAVLTTGLIWLTNARSNDLPTEAQTDPNALPVQMANPPTGAGENDPLGNSMMPSALGNSEMPGGVPGAPGGYEYDPWANGGRPPGGAKYPAGSVPYPVGPGGQQIYIPGNSDSPFMDDGNRYVLVPANSNTPTNKPPTGTPTPKTKVTPTPASTTGPAGEPTTDPTPATKPPTETATPAPKPTTSRPRTAPAPKPDAPAKPAVTPPPASKKPPVSGKEQDS